MPLTPVLLISVLFHALIAWRLLPDLSQSVGILLGGVLLVSAVLMPQGLRAYIAKAGSGFTPAGVPATGAHPSVLVHPLKLRYCA